MQVKEHLTAHSREIASKPTRHGAGYKKSFFGKGELQNSHLVHADLSSLEPGEAVEVHVHESKEETYYFISGQGEMQLNDRHFPVDQGSFIWVAANTVHGLKNTGEVTLTFIIHGVESR